MKIFENQNILIQKHRRSILRWKALPCNLLPDLELPWTLTPTVTLSYLGLLRVKIFLMEVSASSEIDSVCAKWPPLVFALSVLRLLIFRVLFMYSFAILKICVKAEGLKREMIEKLNKFWDELNSYWFQCNVYPVCNNLSCFFLFGFLYWEKSKFFLRLNS